MTEGQYIHPLLYGVLMRGDTYTPGGESVGLRRVSELPPLRNNVARGSIRRVSTGKIYRWYVVPSGYSYSLLLNEEQIGSLMKNIIRYSKLILNQNESRFPTMDNWVNIAIKPR